MVQVPSLNSSGKCIVIFFVYVLGSSVSYSSQAVMCNVPEIHASLSMSVTRSVHLTPGWLRRRSLSTLFNAVALRSKVGWWRV